MKKETKQYKIKEDCIITHLATVYSFKKGDIIEDQKVIDILDKQGLIELLDKQDLLETEQKEE